MRRRKKSDEMACVIRRCVWKYYACHRSVHGRRREEKPDQSFLDHRLVVCRKGRFGGGIGRNPAAKSLLKCSGGDAGGWKKLQDSIAQQSTFLTAENVSWEKKAATGEGRWSAVSPQEKADPETVYAVQFTVGPKQAAAVFHKIRSCM